MSRIGVFVCHCGINIAGTVDVKRVAKEMRQHPDVVYTKDYKYMCSEPGQRLLKEAIKKRNLDGVVVAACSPAMHEKTFRGASASVGMNPYRCEIANIREQCSWVHAQEPERATAKSLDIIHTLVEKTARDEELEPSNLPLTKRALVIGGGPAGMQAALDVASAGYPVVLVEREEHLGGKMAQLSGTYINFNAAPDLSQRRVEKVLNHPNIQVLRGAQVSGVEGYVGNFEVTVGSTQVNKDTSKQGEDDLSTCLPVSSSTDSTFDVGAIVVATGWTPYPQERLPEYGGGKIADVVDGLTFEKMLQNGAAPRRPSDGRVPREVVFVQCAGSRDPERGVPYCSKVCCMYVAKQATMFKERVPEGQAYVFYIDIRSAGKGYDEYVQRAMEEQDVLYLRGKVSKIFQSPPTPPRLPGGGRGGATPDTGGGDRGGKVIVWGADTLSGQSVEVAADLVVLATPMAPDPHATELAQTLRIGIDQNNFFSEAHPKLRPVESLTAGMFLAGAAQGPKDIPETVAQASGAAAKVLQLFSQDEMIQEPTVAYVIEEVCSGCGVCVGACPYDARALDSLHGVVKVNAALCQNCGACVSACPNKASQIYNWTPEQILAMADVLMS